MSNIVKWGILAAAVVALIALVVALPFGQYINVSEFSSALSGIATICGNAFRFGRGLLNNFLTPFGRTVLTGLLAYFFGKFFFTVALKIVAWIQHFIFRG